MSTKLIVGLGNPGSKYQWTRHNAGFMVLDRLSHVSGIPVTKKRFSGFYGEGSWKNERLLLLKPQTFMNLSGQSVAEALRFHKIDLQNLLVIHDDLDIPYGRVKLKEGGGHAGHNGLRSLVSELGGGGFIRIRVGIGRPRFGDAADYVLSNFTKDELVVLPQMVDEIIDLLDLYLMEGLGKAKSVYNNRDLLDITEDSSC
jgi:PTH1 family peptidyl-tRNA hydrolase